MKAFKRALPDREHFNLALFFVGVVTEGQVVELLQGLYYGPWELVRFLLVQFTMGG